MNPDTDPTIWLYVAETGEKGESASNRLAFHELEDAKDWLNDVADRPGAIAFEQEDEMNWFWEGPLGCWARIQKTPVAEPVQLLRDDGD